MTCQAYCMKKIKSSAFDRRMAITKAGTFSSVRSATGWCQDAFFSKEEKQQRKEKRLKKESHYLVSELGKLKGSVVKIGQLLGVFGAQVLPEVVINELRLLNDNTHSLDWKIVKRELKNELGEFFDDFLIDPNPIGTASLAQVYKATIKKTGEDVCLKIQYPGIAEAIDSDLKDLSLLLRLSGYLSKDDAFDNWMDEFSVMLHQEVDYVREKQATQYFYKALKNDNRFVVPFIYEKYCSKKLLVMSYEPGFKVDDAAVRQTSQKRKNKLGQAFLDLFLKEVFLWGVIQTDPNSGNYLVRLAEDDYDDKIILLDFGAVKFYPSDFAEVFRELIAACYYKDKVAVVHLAKQANILRGNIPVEVEQAFAEVCIAAIEPANYSDTDFGVIVDQEGQYDWQASQLTRRVGKLAIQKSLSKNFSAPSEDFIFLSRKLVGVYQYIAALGACFSAKELVLDYLDT